MDTLLTSLEDLLPKGAASARQRPFDPCARYYAPMDCVIYLRMDLPYRAGRVDEFLTLLWHPYENTAIGVKIKGFRRLYEALRAVAAASGDRILTDADFLPLMKAVEAAMTMRAGAMMTDHVAEGRLTDQRKLTDTYAQAFRVVGNATFDPSELMPAA